MKKIYENFEEIADDFIDGYSWSHQMSKHTNEECLGWQKGVDEFANFLDKLGLKIIENPELCDELWDYRKLRFDKHETKCPLHNSLTKTDENI